MARTERKSKRKKNCRFVGAPEIGGEPVEWPRLRQNDLNELSLKNRSEWVQLHIGSNCTPWPHFLKGKEAKPSVIIARSRFGRESR